MLPSLVKPDFVAAEPHRRCCNPFRPGAQPDGLIEISRCRPKAWRGGLPRGADAPTSSLGPGRVHVHFGAKMPSIFQVESSRFRLHPWNDRWVHANGSLAIRSCPASVTRTLNFSSRDNKAGKPISMPAARIPTAFGRFFPRNCPTGRVLTPRLVATTTNLR
jgi:hypothetical protein